MILLTLVLLSLSFSSGAVVSLNEHERAVVNALEILNELGVRTESLCHSNNSFTSISPSILPRCEENAPAKRERFSWRSLQEENSNKRKWWLHVLGAVICVMLSALMSGLTVSLLSMDPLWLLIKMRAAATKTEQRQAAQLLPVVKQHHLLLVTLLLHNSLASEALPVFLGTLMSGYFAVILSVVLVLFFSEILPSAIFTGPNQVALASRLMPAVHCAMWLTYPIALPIAKLLDWWLDRDENDETNESGLYNRGEMAALIRIHYEARLAAKHRRKLQRQEAAGLGEQDLDTIRSLDFSNNSRTDDDMQSSLKAFKSHSNRRLHLHRRNSSSLHEDEVQIVEGALQMKTKMAVDIFVPLTKVYCIPDDTILNEQNLVKLYTRGYSRVPVFQSSAQSADCHNNNQNKAAICGFLLTKQLILVDADDAMSVSKMPLYIPMCVPPDMNLVELVNLFQTGGHGKQSLQGGHLALVCARPKYGNAALEQGDPVPPEAGLMGIITLEDVLEALLQEAIYDEMDKVRKSSSSGDDDNVNIETGSYYRRVEDRDIT